MVSRSNSNPEEALDRMAAGASPRSGGAPPACRIVVCAKRVPGRARLRISRPSQSPAAGCSPSESKRIGDSAVPIARSLASSCTTTSRPGPTSTAAQGSIWSDAPAMTWIPFGIRCGDPSRDQLSWPNTVEPWIVPTLQDARLAVAGHPSAARIGARMTLPAPRTETDVGLGIAGPSSRRAQPTAVIRARHKARRAKGIRPTISPLTRGEEPRRARLCSHCVEALALSAALDGE